MRNGSGSYSLPAGNPVISGTDIESTWANNTLADIAAEITSSLDRSGRGGMLAQFKAVDGTASAPGLSFSNEPSSGIYRASAGNLQLSVLTTTLVTFTASGVAVTGTLSTTGTITASGAVTAPSFSGSGAGLTNVPFASVTGITGTPSASTYLRGDGAWTTPPAGTGTVTSVNLTAPGAGIAVSGGPITASGSITLALADDLAALEGLAGTGIARRTGTSTWDTVAAIDISTETSGNLSVSRLNGGSGASAGTYWRGDGTWAAAPADAVSSVAGKTGAVTLVKGDVGLGSADNTSDADKPVSTATQTALNLKANLAAPALTGNATIDGSLIGFRDIVRVTGGIERGKVFATSAGFTLNTSSLSEGYAYSVYNDSAAAITITQGSGVTQRLAGTTLTGNRTIAPRGLATIWANSGTEAIFSGPGVS